jgi:hypothetical protein
MPSNFMQACVASSLPIFLATAWVRSQRSLSRQLTYDIPLSLQWRIPCIQRFWLFDLLLATVALVLGSPLAGLPGLAFDRTRVLPGVSPELSGLAYPATAMLLGVAWPRISRLSITIGVGEKQAQTLSFARLRDLLLGAPAVKAINAKLQVEVASYVDRVVDAVGPTPSDAAALVESATAAGRGEPAGHRPGLREALLKGAERDFESLYLSVGRVRMVPFLGRRRPLMLVPDMTSREEETLYRAGIKSVRDLIRGASADDLGLPRERLALLRLNAQGLVRQRVGAALSLFAVVAVMVALGSLSSQLVFHEGTHPRKGAPYELTP